MPGVRELFAEMDDVADKKKLQRNRNRGDLYKNITPDYYGYRDDDDGILVEKEKKAEVCFVNIVYNLSSSGSQLKVVFIFLGLANQGEY